MNNRQVLPYDLNGNVRLNNCRGTAGAFENNSTPVFCIKIQNISAIHQALLLSWRFPSEYSATHFKIFRLGSNDAIATSQDNHFLDSEINIFHEEDLIEAYNDIGEKVAQVHKKFDPKGIINTESFVLLHNQWNQISLSLSPPTGNDTVEAVFGDDISGVYGEDWKLFAYNPMSNEYVTPRLEDKVSMGTGYWVIQVTGQDVTVDLPENSTLPSLVLSSQCSSLEGCFEIDLPTRTNEKQWSMLGHPFAKQTNWSSLRVTTSDHTCDSTAGCTIDETEEQNIFHNQAWHYNPVTKAYDLIKNSTSLNNWDGFWSLTLPNAEGTNPKLLVPN